MASEAHQQRPCTRFTEHSQDRYPRAGARRARTRSSRASRADIRAVSEQLPELWSAVSRVSRRSCPAGRHVGLDPAPGVEQGRAALRSATTRRGGGVRTAHSRRRCGADPRLVPSRQRPDAAAGPDSRSGAPTSGRQPCPSRAALRGAARLGDPVDGLVHRRQHGLVVVRRAVAVPRRPREPLHQRSGEALECTHVVVAVEVVTVRRVHVRAQPDPRVCEHELRAAHAPGQAVERVAL